MVDEVTAVRGHLQGKRRRRRLGSRLAKPGRLECCRLAGDVWTGLGRTTILRGVISNDPDLPVTACPSAVKLAPKTDASAKPTARITARRVASKSAAKTRLPSPGAFVSHTEYGSTANLSRTCRTGRSLGLYRHASAGRHSGFRLDLAWTEHRLSRPRQDSRCHDIPARERRHARLQRR